MNKIRLALLLVKEIGIAQLTQYAIYQLGLRTGHYRRVTPAGGWSSRISRIPDLEKEFPLSTRPPLYNLLEESEKNRILQSAQTICSEKYFPFGGGAAPLGFDPIEDNLKHWTEYGSTLAGHDIKEIWEPARFSWVFPLIQAYAISGNDQYAGFFWKKFGQFIQNNPVNLGPAWSSAQEVALRIIPWVWATNVFKDAASTTTEMVGLLLKTMEDSARRILPTLSYARSQNNNHLLSESLGLVIVGKTLLGVHPSARNWMNIGFREFEYGLLIQVDETGNYTQQSTNYHRLMLQLSLLYYAYAQHSGHVIPSEIKAKLSKTTHFLLSLLDEESGQVPNLGHNDGAFLLPFGADGYRDYRPTLQAASIAFQGSPALPAGKWDELSQWLGISKSTALVPYANVSTPAILRVGDKAHWATMRAVRYHSRPAHGDQLSVDIWWNGENIAMDAGTYLYNSPSPWENALARTAVHNTVMIDGQDQMLRVGKFLALDRLNAAVVGVHANDRASAQILPNDRIHIVHKRTLEWNPPHRFFVTDELFSPLHAKSSHSYSLQWLLPDWNWKFIPSGIELHHESTCFQLRIEAESVSGSLVHPEISLIRAGETLYGTQQDPIRGWVSPTYGTRIPALSIVYEIESSSPVKILSVFDFLFSSLKTG